MSTVESERSASREERTPAWTPRNPTGGRTFLDPWLIGAALLGLVLRVVYALTSHITSHIGDQIEYEQLAHNFKSYWGPGLSPYRFWGTGTLTRPPGYPLFLAINYNLGLGENAIRIEQAILVSAACLLLSTLVARTVDLRAGRVTGIVAALYPPLITLSSPILSDPLSAVLCLASVYQLVSAYEHRGSGSFEIRLASASLLAAAATLVHPNVVPIFVLVLAVALLARRSWRQRASAVLAALLAAMLLFAPWMARNFAVAGSLTPLSKNETNSARGIHLPVYKASGEFGSYRRSYYYFTPSPPGLTPAEALSRPLNVSTAHLVNARKTLIDNLKHRPLRQMATSLYWEKELWLVAFDDHTQYGAKPIIPWWLIQGAHLLVLCAALVGAWFTRRLLVTRLAVAFAFFLALPYTLIVPNPRYALPAVFLLLAPAALGAIVVFEAARRRWVHRSRLGTRAAATE